MASQRTAFSARVFGDDRRRVRQALRIHVLVPCRPDGLDGDDELRRRVRPRPYPRAAERQRHAADWRRVRQALRRYDGTVKADLIALWQSGPLAGEPKALLALIHMYDNGRLALEPCRPESYGVFSTATSCEQAGRYKEAE